MVTMSDEVDDLASEPSLQFYWYEIEAASSAATWWGNWLVECIAS
jgi:hypothetical protein